MRPDRPYSVDVALKDVSVTALRLLIDGPAPDPLAAATLTHPVRPGLSLHLAVIGASHVITAEGPGRHFREEISCATHEGSVPLPPRAARPGYELETSVEKQSDAELDALAARLASRKDEPGHLVVAFPGEGSAHVTALRAEGTTAGWQWWTWHLYPRENAVARTLSQLNVKGWMR